MPGSVRAPHVLVERADREAQLDAGAASRLDETVEVAEHERALREDRERVPGLAEDLDDALRQPVLPLGALVRVGVGPHRDVLTPPAARRELGAQLLHRVDLHDDHAVEVRRRVEVQVLVRGPSEAIFTSMLNIPGTR